MAEAGDRTIDEPTLDFGHRLIAKPQFLQDAGTKVFNQDIGSLDQFPQHTLAFSRLEIEAQAFLVSIDGQKIRTDSANKRRSPLPAIVTRRRRLNFNHLGAHICQQHAADRSRQNSGKVDDKKIIQRLHVSSSERCCDSVSTFFVEHTGFERKPSKIRHQM